ncbi:hypothetical protein H5410_015308 [Solanum commersonii]|uniref:Uncharacterized protein n=1 Tax=Solanum commersonii TaxID=4109 RepID=A0A9J5ZU13_SOLCO|nr:hypothetical protein H5410_015308 [Solanum commersonii]
MSNGVREFYANLMETNMSNRLITIGGKVVDCGSKAINFIYGLKRHYTEAFMDKDCESGTKCPMGYYKGIDRGMHI